MPAHATDNVPASKKGTLVGASAYAHAKTGGFSLEPPVLHNPYRDDPVLDRALRRLLPQKEYETTSADLVRFGDRIVNEITDMARQCELKKPVLVPQDAWGRRTDNLIVCDEWYRLKGIMAEEGLVAIGYDQSRDASHRRIHQTIKLLMYAPSSGLTSCPLAMTDGAVKVLLALGLDKTFPEVYERLLSTDPARAWTSGQWMTERRGGSDVGGATDTYAVHESGDTYRLNGYKWFSSAVDADVAFTLARIVDEKGETTEGSKGLSLFLLRLRNGAGQLNGIQMVRLKDKLGTRQLPTAELLLDGVEATLISEPGRGIASISHMLNVTRLHNAAACVGGMRRLLSLARDYSTRRSVFGQLLRDWPLHTRTLAEIEVEVRSITLFLLDVARLIGLQESGKATEEVVVTVRLLTPVIKAYTAKVGSPIASELLECFGGMGYMEDTGIPALLRDGQVATIWEGTTNVLSLDVLRVMATRDNVIESFAAVVRGHVQQASQSRDNRVSSCAHAVLSALSSLSERLVPLMEAAFSGTVRVDAGARQILLNLGRIYCGALVTKAAAYEDATATEIVTAHRFCTEKPLTVPLDDSLFGNSRVDEDRKIVFENYVAKI